MGRNTLSKGKQVAVPDMGATPEAVAAEEAATRQHLIFAESLLPADMEYELESMICGIQADAAIVANGWLRIGLRLLAIKEHEPHGVFQQVVDKRLGMHPRTAQRFMLVAVRFAGRRLGGKSDNVSHLPYSKLLELAALEDDDLDSLEEGKTVQGLTLDKIDQMSTRELRDALRKKDQDIEAKDSRAEKRERELERKTAEIARLKRQSLKADPDQLTTDLRRELTGEAIGIEALIVADGKDVSSLRTRIAALVDHGEATGEDQRVYIAGICAQLERCLHLVRSDHGIPIEAVGDPYVEAQRTLAPEE